MKRNYTITLEAKATHPEGTIRLDDLYRDIQAICEDLDVFVLKISITKGLLKDSKLEIKCSPKDKNLFLDRLNSSRSGHYINFFYH